MMPRLTCCIRSRKIAGIRFRRQSFLNEKRPGGATRFAHPVDLPERSAWQERDCVRAKPRQDTRHIQHRHREHVEPNEKLFVARIHVDRTPGRDRDHRHPGRVAVARVKQSEGKGEEGLLLQQSEANGPGDDYVRR